MNAAEHIALSLERRGVTHVFELVGGMITFLLDAMHRRTGIRVVSMHHEQGAGFAAEGWGRMMGIPAVAMATSGPGATNLLTAIGSCYFDSTPAVFITGQVNRHEQKGDRAIRQLGFQETDIVAMARPVVKAAWMVTDATELPAMLDEAFRLAASGRPGPVLIDIPMDVQRAEVADPEDHAATFPVGGGTGSAAAARDWWQSFLAVLSASRHPLILSGGGIRSARAAQEFREVVDRLGIPVVHSLMGVDNLPADHPLRVGLIGSYGNRWANTALAESDLLLVLGSRLDIRQTGADTDAFREGRTIFHVDCEEGEMNNRVTRCRTFCSDLRPFLESVLTMPWGRKDCAAWITEIRSLEARWPDTAELAGMEGINPNEFMRELSAGSSAAAGYLADVGQHQMWAAQSLRLGPHQRFLTSGGMGAMGFALPAGIGACLGASGQPVVVIAGDGGFQLNIQELQTVARLGLPLKMVVLNNSCHGMVRQFQESYFHGRYQSTVWGYSAPDFSRVAGAYGIAALRVDDPTDVAGGICAMWEHPAQPFLLEVMVPMQANAYPKMAFGRPMSEMEPLAKPIEMEGT
ncbi:MAG: acetolactate synthase, large subunit [Verrucomicrobiota bacterium]|jgi:acetolactate synthase-1/2/3 large subunit